MVTYVDAATAPLKNTGHVRLYGRDAFAGMHRAGRLAAECLDALTPLVQPGVSTDEIDAFVYDFGVSRGALPATLYYRGYRKSTCTSINHVVCHGIPERQGRCARATSSTSTSPSSSTAGTAIPAACTAVGQLKPGRRTADRRDL